MLLNEYCNRLFFVSGFGPLGQSSFVISMFIPFRINQKANLFQTISDFVVLAVSCTSNNVLSYS